MKYWNTILIMLMTAVLMINFPSCRWSGSQQDQDEENRAVQINYTDWSESIAITLLAATVLEEKMGYEVDLKLTDVESIYRELAEGEADYFADAWLPLTHREYFVRHENNIDTIGRVFRNPQTGLVVPEYSELRSIPDLREKDIPILGIDAGAGIMTNTNEALAHYGLENELMVLSDDQMTFQMTDSLRRKKEVVVTGWEPHWIFNRHKVRFLEDPDQVFPTGDHIYSIANKNSMEEHPHATEFFRRMQLTEKQFNSLIDHVKVATEPRNGVLQWMEKNEYVVNKWVKDLQPERLKIM
ncbi:MAG: glycine betaine ABC transporter substrate-binding protein [Marinilabiliaceae bacterium]